MIYLPAYLNESLLLKDIAVPVDSALRELEVAVDELVNQLAIPSAGHLEPYEALFGIPTDLSKPLVYRRQRLLTKLQGTGTITTGFIANMAANYENGVVQVRENPTDQTVDIRFTSMKGIPPNLDDFKRMLEEVAPAHLKITYSYTYLTRREFDGAQITAGDFDDLRITAGLLGTTDFEGLIYPKRSIALAFSEH